MSSKSSRHAQPPLFSRSRSRSRSRSPGPHSRHNSGARSPSAHSPHAPHFTIHPHTAHHSTSLPHTSHDSEPPRHDQQPRDPLHRRDSVVSLHGSPSPQRPSHHAHASPRRSTTPHSPHDVHSGGVIPNATGGAPAVIGALFVSRFETLNAKIVKILTKVESEWPTTDRPELRTVLDGWAEAFLVGLQPRDDPSVHLLNNAEYRRIEELVDRMGENTPKLVERRGHTFHIKDQYAASHLVESLDLLRDRRRASHLPHLHGPHLHSLEPSHSPSHAHNSSPTTHKHASGAHLPHKPHALHRSKPAHSLSHEGFRIGLRQAARHGLITYGSARDGGLFLSPPRT